MSRSNILFLSGFQEGETTSMALYADGLLGALRKYHSTEFDSYEYTPKMLLHPWFRGVWGMRFARFLLYPLQVPHQPHTITHLLDHGYAHLFYTYKPERTVVTVTDLMPVLWWKRLLPVKTKKHIPLTVLYSLFALKRASHIIAISSNTKNDLVRLIGCDPSKISVVYLGIDSIFKPYNHELKNAIRNKLFGNGPKNLILITGSQFYKNHETALKTMSYLLSRGYQNIYLVKTGNPNQIWLGWVKKYGLEDRVINIGFIPRDQMPDLYNAVDILLFPSLYEGFGWPPLESMACGTPSVTSNVASLPEIMGSIDTMCDPFDYIGFAQKIETLLFNDDYRQRVIKQGIIQAAKFSWEDVAKKTIDVYNLIEGK